jgi:UDP-N-acetylmuramate dehydrogenase
MLWPKALIKNIRSGVPLAKYTTFKIGGKAEYYFEPQNNRQLSQVLRSAARNAPIFLLGAGSNILVSDSGVAGLVIRLCRANFKKISVRGKFIRCHSAVTLSQLAQAAKSNGLSGAEFLAGIPGTVGGAVLMNAGAWGSSIADIVEEIQVMGYNGKVKVLKKNNIKFGYRCSGLEKYIILSAKLRFSPKDKAAIDKLMREYLRRRVTTQNTRFANAGCIFKNPAGCSAGKLIDQCGLKGASIGNAIVCRKHANFILNRGKARSADVLELMRHIRGSVRSKFKVDLQPEIKVWR